ncbi:hypothetical protein D046_3327A, partial [Vibrio parahaemolyticus V-223/04]
MKSLGFIACLPSSTSHALLP